MSYLKRNVWLPEEKKIPAYEIFRKGEKVGVVFDPMLVDLLTDFLNAASKPGEERPYKIRKNRRG